MVRIYDYPTPTRSSYRWWLSQMVYWQAKIEDCYNNRAPHSYRHIRAEYYRIAQANAIGFASK